MTNIIHSIGNPLDDVNMTSDLLSNLTSKLLEYDYAPLFDISLDIEKTTKQDILKVCYYIEFAQLVKTYQEIIQ